jgi:hypothetical protein
MVDAVRRRFQHKCVGVREQGYVLQKFSSEPEPSASRRKSNAECPGLEGVRQPRRARGAANGLAKAAAGTFHVQGQ